MIIDKLISCLKSRISAYDEVHTKFRVLSDFKTLPIDDIRAIANILADTYPGDLDKTVLAAKMIQLVEYAKANECDAPGDVAQLHIDQLNDTFPNVCVALRIYPSLMVSNYSDERSFNKMALIENKLRSTMNDRRLSALQVLSLESDVLETTTFDDIIEQFALAKTRACFR